MRLPLPHIVAGGVGIYLVSLLAWLIITAKPGEPMPDRSAGFTVAQYRVYRDLLQAKTDHDRMVIASRHNMSPIGGHSVAMQVRDQLRAGYRLGKPNEIAFAYDWNGETE